MKSNAEACTFKSVGSGTGARLWAPAGKSDAGARDFVRFADAPQRPGVCLGTVDAVVRGQRMYSPATGSTGFASKSFGPICSSSADAGAI